MKTDQKNEKTWDNIEIDPTNSPEQPQEKQEDPLQELTNLLKLTQANFENYRKQTEKRVEEIKQYASQDILVQLLPILDNFKLALETIEKNNTQQDLLKGIELIYAQLNELLENNNIKIIVTEKQKFDPYQHEALMKVPSDQPEGTILEEFQRGYTLNSKVIRHARVKISAGNNIQGGN